MDDVKLVKEVLATNGTVSQELIDEIRDICEMIYRDLNEALIVATITFSFIFQFFMTWIYVKKTGRKY